MKLYIAEKPSLGRAIAEVLPKPHKKQQGYIEVGNGDVVSWCIGHLLEQAEPDAYDDAYKKWRLEHLPIVPEAWQLKKKANTSKQLTVLRGLVKKATSLVHAGDPDREGQLLVDEVIEFLKTPAKKKNSAQRLLISDLNPAAVKTALNNLQPNSDYIPLSVSALARSRADWLYGMNMTRAYTLQGQKVGYQGVLSVGRVQTPILGLVVRRDQEIANFISKPFYEVIAHLQTQQQETFTAKWKPSEACRPYMDEDGRVLVKKLAENVVHRIQGQMGEVTKLEKKNKQQAAPLPYSLSSLQIDAAKRFGMSAQQVLDTCQALYERHKLLTYPRSDSRYLPKEHYAHRSGVIAAIAQTSSNLSQAAHNADQTLRSKAWNDSKVEAHHAIIPTEKKASVERLTTAEKNIYELVARQYLCQFYPAYEYADTVAEITIAGGLFVAKAKMTLKPGWKVLFPKSANSSDKQTEAEKEQAAQLPAIKKGEQLLCERGECLEKQTQPPKHFTDATLLAAMTGIARYVQDSDIRKILKDTDGLGTEATRAGIIELLFRRNFLLRSGKAILATDAGKGLINALPESATLPDMTAQWESVLDGISKKEASYQTFMGNLLTQLAGMIEQAKTTVPDGLRGLSSGKPAARRFKKKATSKRC
ncbi:MAG: DNA topoisomerase-3 [Moritella sp.]|jgi:DNA topoisomerase-3